MTELEQFKRGVQGFKKLYDFFTDETGFTEIQDVQITDSEITIKGGVSDSVISIPKDQTFSLNSLCQQWNTLYESTEDIKWNYNLWQKNSTNHFWRIRLEGTAIILEWGRTSSTKVSRLQKTYLDVTTATKIMNKKVREKLESGWIPKEKKSVKSKTPEKTSSTLKPKAKPKPKTEPSSKLKKPVKKPKSTKSTKIPKSLIKEVRRLDKVLKSTTLKQITRK